MGITNCVSKEDKNEIHIVFTDTLKRNGSVLFSLDVDKNNTSVQDLSKYLDDDHKVKSSSYTQGHEEISELFKIIDKKTENTL